MRRGRERRRGERKTLPRNFCCVLIKLACLRYVPLFLSFLYVVYVYPRPLLLIDPIVIVVCYSPLLLSIDIQYSTSLHLSILPPSLSLSIFSLLVCPLSPHGMVYLRVTKTRRMALLVPHLFISLDPLLHNLSSLLKAED